MTLGNESFQVDTEAPQSGTDTRDESLRLWLPLIFAAAGYLILLARMDTLLRDSDTYWHVVVGQWIIDHGAVPHFDLFSFTMRGAPWIASAWLSEVLYFAAFKMAGWSGPAILAALAATLAFFLLTLFLRKRLPNVAVAILVGAGIAMLTPRTLARPHALIFPLLVLWANALIEAAEGRRAPSIACLPLITLWANFHGSFTLGLVLIAPFAIEALWGADKSARLTIALQWLRFGLLAVGAACITPYGVEAALVTFRILDLGGTLSNIGEWRPLDFGTPNPVTVCLLAGAAYALYSGLKLPPLRIAALLALIYETYAHTRYLDVSALMVPLLIAGPLGRHLAWMPPRTAKAMSLSRRTFIAAIAALAILTGVVAAAMDHAPPRAPRIAVEKLKELKANRILNEYYFCGYLIFQGIPTFIDSRAELYGAPFLNRYLRAIWLDDVTDFVKLLDEYKIDATLFFPSTQAVQLLDRLPEWERVYTDDVAVVHVRRTRPDIVRSLK